jgi:hypothetical protein
MVDIWIRCDFFIHQLARRVVITRAEQARAAQLRVDPHARLVNPGILIRLVFHLALILDLSSTIRSVGGDSGRKRGPTWRISSTCWASAVHRDSRLGNGTNLTPDLSARSKTNYPRQICRKARKYRSDGR